MSLLFSKRSLLIAALCVLFKLFVLSFAWHLAAQHSHPVLGSWDAAYYKSIAESGYIRYQAVLETNLAFFPAFPFLARGLMTVFHCSFEVASVSLNLALFGLCILLFLEWLRLLGVKNRNLVVLLYTLDRFTLWSHLPYTEALFVCTILTFLIVARSSFAKTAGGSFLIAGLGGFATSIRLVGVSLIGSWGLPRFQHYLRKPLLGFLTLLVGLWGVIAFFGYLQISQGNWRYSLMTTDHWQRHFSLVGFFRSSFFLLKFAYFPTLLVLIAGAWLLFRRSSLLVLSSTEKCCFFLLVFIPMAQSLTVSLTRFLTMFLVGYIGWAEWILASRKAAWRALWICILIIEIYQQIHLTEKFLLGQVFNWAC